MASSTLLKSRHDTAVSSKLMNTKITSQLQQTKPRRVNGDNQTNQTSAQTGTVYNTGGAGLNVRLGPGTNYGRISGLKEGSSVKILGSENGWYQIQYGTITGFVSSKYIKLDSDRNDQQNSIKPEDPGTGDNDNEPGKVKQDDPIGTATITAGAVTVREGAGYMYNRVFGLSKGKSVSVLEKKDGWIRISCNDQTGWIYGPNTDFDSFSSGTVTGSQAVADHVRDNCPNGFNVCFAYPLTGSSNDAEFQNQAGRFIKMYNTIGITDGALKIQDFMILNDYDRLITHIKQITAGVRKCLAEHPRPGFDDSKCTTIRNLTIMCHGDPDAIYFHGGSFNIGQVQDFAKKVKGYLRNDVNVQLYACSTARNPGVSANWYERWSNGVIEENDPGIASNSYKGSFAQKLSEALGPEASVFGHTVAGHLCNTYCARCFGAAAGGNVNGKHMFDYYFPAWFVEEQAIRVKGDASTANKNSVRTSMYEYYTQYGMDGGCEGRDSFIEPDVKGEKLRAAWVARN